MARNRRSNDNPFGFGSVDFGLGSSSSSGRNRRSNNSNPFGIGSLDLGGGFFGQPTARRKKQAPQDTCNYTLRQGRKVVYHGISNNPERRIQEHLRDGKKNSLPILFLVDVQETPLANVKKKKLMAMKTAKVESQNTIKFREVSLFAISYLQFRFDMAFLLYNWNNQISFLTSTTTLSN